MTEDMRAEFERTNGRDHRRQPPKGNNYIDPMAQTDWESFQKGWAQSRATLEIELPESSSTHNSEVIKAVGRHLIKQGLKVKT